MIDIETLSTNSNGLVISISAIEFDLMTGNIGREFETGLKLKDQIAKGAVIDIDTVMWWLDQSKEAQKSLLSLVDEFHVEIALDNFNIWLDELECKNKNIRLWGNGATFDNVIVRNLYERHGITFNLPFWCDRDVRTLVDLADIQTKDYKFDGIKHNGIDDCLHQIKYCVDAYKKL